MPFETEMKRRVARLQGLRRLAYELRTEARMAEEEHRGLRITHSRVQRELSALWSRANRAHNGSVYSQYDAGRARTNAKRYGLLQRIVDELSDTLLELRDKIAAAEEVWTELVDRAEAAEIAASRAAARLDEFAQDRKHLIATIAGVPDPQLSTGAYVVRVNSRNDNKIDVYYNDVGLEPLGEGHGHIALNFDCTLRFPPRPPKQAAVRIAPKPGSWLVRRPRRMTDVPAAA